MSARPKRDPSLPGDRALARWLLVALVASSGGCHQVGPEDPSPLPIARSVSVTIQYEQPALCTGPTERCNDAVVFFASWMPDGQGLVLQGQAGRVHTGRAAEVPVNFPPRGEPFEVRVLDPHLLNNPAGGQTAELLTVGGERLTHVEGEGGPHPRAYVYIDSNGQGHNPF